MNTEPVSISIICRATRWLPTLSALLLAPIAARLPAHPPVMHVSEDVRRATTRFLHSLDDPLSRQATFGHDNPERTNWHFIPKHRPGVALKAMNLEQRRAAHALLRTALSDQGYLKATAIMALEQVLRELESQRPGVDQIRDQENYWFSVFGDPSAEGAWGWRVEGHHLSLNFSALSGKLIATTPAFWGANPAEIRTGPQAGLRVLGREEDLARQIVELATETQRAAIVVADEAPRDILTGPGTSLEQDLSGGLMAGEMTARQQRLVRQLIGQFAHNLRGPLARREMQKIEEAGLDQIRFAWAGGLDRSAPHYWRLVGPTFIIEYDNTQNDANHVHTVWHSRENDFGLNVLREHYRQQPHPE